MKDHLRIIDTHCPFCRKAIDSSLATEENGRAPKPRDPSVCIKCAGIAMFDPNMKLAEPTPDILAAWQADRLLWSELQRARAIVQSIRR